MLRITGETVFGGSAAVQLTWNSVPTRYYYLQKTPSLAPTSWGDSGLGLFTPSAGSNTTAILNGSPLPLNFYRVEAVRPLIP